VNFFLCLVDAEGREIPEPVPSRYQRLAASRGIDVCRQRMGDLVALYEHADPGDPPLMAAYDGCIAVGAVRLDNRARLEQLVGSYLEALSDLELVLRVVALHGSRYISDFLGDFAFVVWNRHTRDGVAAVDAFAVRKLYWTESGGIFAFCSRAEILASDDRYETQYLAELIALCSPTAGLTPYSGVRSVAASTMAVLNQGRIEAHAYWSPAEFEPSSAWAVREHDAVGLCRELLAEGVRLRLGRNGDTWAQLSGGTDSSSVVSVAQWLAANGRVSHGLAGTVTYADRAGSAADERAYSASVIAQWKVPNQTIVDPPFWIDERWPPPRTDFPCFSLPFYPREHQLCAIVRPAGGRVLLTGTGGDELFTGTMLFFADWIAGGRAGRAMREMADRAAVGRVSFWQLAYLNAVLPLLPAAMQRRLLGGEAQLPAWMRKDVVRRYGLCDRTFPALSYGGRRGYKYRDAIAAHVIGLGTVLDTGTIAPEVLDLRHPFLYRPLVEFALQLPPELLVRPNARKWVLREAMRGIVPDAVRTRIGKGSPAELYASSLHARQEFLQPLVEDSMLAELGIVDATTLRDAFYGAPRQPHSKEHWHAVLQFTLAVEAWLQLRSGRWPRENRKVSS
jgi:asparagine synthase (glutamine-hydrolysing)